MTAPLTPPECDLQDFPFMPLHVARLRDSDLAAEESPEACWYAVLLWAASWHQIPAASLPANDAILAKLIGLGRDVRTFRKHKAGATRGFVLCDDGRLYHPVVAEQAMEAWSSKLQQRWRTECARIKKRNQRDGTNVSFPTFEEFIAAAVPGPGPDFVPRDTTESPEGQTLQGTGTGTGIEDRPPNPPDGGRIGSAKFWAAWLAYPMDGRGNEGPQRPWAEWPTAAERAGGEDALLAATQTHAARCASNSRSAIKSFHRWLRDDGFAAYIEAPTETFEWSGPAAVWSAVVAAKGEPWARSYLAKCSFNDGSLVTTSTTIFRGLRQEVGPQLDALGVPLLQGAAA